MALRHKLLRFSRKIIFSPFFLEKEDGPHETWRMLSFWGSGGISKLSFVSFDPPLRLDPVKEEKMRRKCFLEEEDSDEEEVRGRKVSRRHLKRISYCEEEEVVDEDDEDEDMEEDDEQPGPSNGFNQRAQETSESLQNLYILPVTCENKKGTLHKEKFEKGESCIKCEGQWFSPSGFENFCGRGAMKKWKSSILYKNNPLQFWIEKGLLSTKGFKRRASGTTKRKISSSDSSSKEYEGHSAEENDKDDSRDEDWLPDSDELMVENKNKKAGAENGGGDSSEVEAANDVYDCGGRGKHLSKKEKMGQALKGEPKVVLKRLPVAKLDPQSISMGHSASVGEVRWTGTHKKKQRED
ncbi:uncharacterized protein LOC121503868 isoform X2 [Cheilinus undulatus]|uniref:uncharacterized protein LOC121503868 isoform X2 n=1 Tax=Cheilinus undulatus TaxID=241271 RepID=UPI001BD45DFB|nr:uncharacterized protein LOC121503868 isoform X2 [Cheilinus undulatus]